MATKMKIMFVTTPIRPIPTQYPPIGTLSLMNYLGRHSIQDLEFFNIDANRPSYPDAIAHIRERRPDILAISSVVSTAYAYTKKLSTDVKTSLPETLIVLGGNLAASAEIILRKTSVDLCVLGEGEKILLNIVRRAEKSLVLDDYSDIPGLIFLSKRGDLVNTGFEIPLPKQELYDINWTDLEESLDDPNGINRFFYDPFNLGKSKAVDWFRYDTRTNEPHRQGKRVGQLPGAKGCVARCTFCHRWDKGIRYIPVEILMERVDELIEKYNVGFLTIVDENFGTSRKWLRAFCESIKKRDLLWNVAGMRVNCINPDSIQLMKNSGCTAILYGMETGSEKILEIMEKRVRLIDNYNAMKWTVDAGLHTVIQLVIGMPGESPETIAETVQFTSQCMALSPDQNPNWLSINYAQALPGTPLYEFGRHSGLIGKHIDSEEEYLISISDRNAHDEFATVNYTNFPRLIQHSWRPLIQLLVNYNYVKIYGMMHYHRILQRDMGIIQETERDSGFFAKPRKSMNISMVSGENILSEGALFWTRNNNGVPGLVNLIARRKYGLAFLCYPLVFYRLRKFLLLMILAREYRKQGWRYAIEIAVEYLQFQVGRSRKIYLEQTKTLRKLIRDDLGALPEDDPSMLSLRKGR